MRKIEEIAAGETRIPEVVQAKADSAFFRIRTEGAEMKEKKRAFRRPAVFAACAAVVVLGAGTAFAAANNFWSEGAKKIIQADPVQQQELESQGVANVLAEPVSVTNDGITVTVKEVIADERVAGVTFMITGIDENVLRENAENIYFNGVSAVFANTDEHMAFGGSFYKGENGRILTDENGNPALEYVGICYGSAAESIIGRTLHVTFDKLGLIFEKAGDVEEYISDSSWELDIPFSVKSAAVSFEEDEYIYGPYTVTSVEVSPLSLQVNYSVDGAIEIGADTNIPVVYGLKMKDGTVYNIESELEDGYPVLLRNPGEAVYKNGFASDEEELLHPEKAYATVIFGKVFDPEKIEAVILQPWGEAYLWGDLPDETVAAEYGGEIPFERPDTANPELYYITLK